MNPYPSLDHFVRAHRRLVLPRTCPGVWRLVADAPPGQIVGIPTFRGRAIATNGIHVAIETYASRNGELPQGEAVYKSNIIFGHYLWFVCDDLDDVPKLAEAAMGTSCPKPKISADVLATILEE